MSTLSASDTRRKQSKKDEAIRRKIEAELARKRTISTAQPASRGPKKPGKSVGVKGTVAALRPSPALTVPESITVSDASQLCAAKRTDCVLVVDDDEGLSGIFTAKDLAYRVTAEGLDPRTTPVSAIMTRSPMVTRDTTSATDALQLMVERHFRHLPVCNEEGNVVGLLDITKVFHEALAKVERSSAASQKLFAALEGVHSELGGGAPTNPQAMAMLAYVDALRDKTALPDLTTVIDSRTQPAMVTPKTTVKEAAKLMKSNRTTAVCVMEGGNSTQQGRIAGIFTSKDIVLRVIAAGLDPSNCSIIRVMTPHPDTAPPTMTVQDALKKMHTGHYLNLPVVEADGRLIAVVDVLKLTYATLEQMNTLTASDSHDTGGPLWGKFFDSIAADDAESAISGSHTRNTNTPPPARNSMIIAGSPQSELAPGDSASLVEGDGMDDLPPSITNAPGISLTYSEPLNVPVPIDDGTYVFKFRAPSGRMHRFQARKDDVENLKDIVRGKLEHDPFFTKKEEGPSPEPHDFHLAYKDADGDIVIMSSDTDVEHAVGRARAAGEDRVVLLLHGGKSWEESEVLRKSDSEPAHEKDAGGEQLVPISGDLFGVPKDLLLPATIAALAVAVVGVFTVSRFMRD